MPIPPQQRIQRVGQTWHHQRLRPLLVCHSSQANGSQRWSPWKHGEIMRSFPAELVCVVGIGIAVRYICGGTLHTTCPHFGWNTRNPPATPSPYASSSISRRIIVKLPWLCQARVKTKIHLRGTWRHLEACTLRARCRESDKHTHVPRPKYNFDLFCVLLQVDALNLPDHWMKLFFLAHMDLELQRNKQVCMRMFLFLYFGQYAHEILPAKKLSLRRRKDTNDTAFLTKRTLWCCENSIQQMWQTVTWRHLAAWHTYACGTLPTFAL